jgi:hypothetical protein
MKYNIELLKADIHAELQKIDCIKEQFDSIEGKIDLPSADVSYYDRGAIGYILHNFYNGCENIFISIAKFFENDVGPQTWHRDLLKRMRLEVPGFRPNVIDEALYLLLDDFRSFRHKFRHTYTFELDWEKEQAVAKKLNQTAQLFKKQIVEFLDHLDGIED